MQNIQEKVAQGLVVMKGLPSWEASTRILCQVCTGAARPNLKCASGVTEATTNLGKLDKVHPYWIGPWTWGPLGFTVNVKLLLSFRG